MKARNICLFAFILCLLVSCVSVSKPAENTLVKRLDEYKEAFNHGKDSPQKIYSFLCMEYKEKISEKDFVEAYLKDRTYPYITPFYIWQPVYELSEDCMSAHASYQQAARIVGMTWDIDLVYENGNYFVKDWEYLIDGSYLKKFENCPYTLDWYYDTENMK